MSRREEEECTKDVINGGSNFKGGVVDDIQEGMTCSRYITTREREREKHVGHISPHLQTPNTHTQQIASRIIETLASEKPACHGTPS